LTDKVNVANNATGSVNLVAVTDYAANTELTPKGVTFVRARGNLTFVAQVDADVAVFWAVFVLDQDQTSPDPTNFQNLIDERVLYWGTCVVRANASVTYTYHFEPIDLKAKARLSDQDVRFVFRATGGSAGTVAQVTSNWRMLLVGEAT